MVTWIDAHPQEYTVEQVGFRIDHSNPIRHTAHTTLALTPARANQSHAITLWGWCGASNDNHTYGNGIWKVQHVAKNGRVAIEEVTDPEEVMRFLEEIGYPDLFEQWDAGVRTPKH